MMNLLLFTVGDNDFRRELDHAAELLFLLHAKDRTIERESVLDAMDLAHRTVMFLAGDHSRNLERTRHYFESGLRLWVDKEAKQRCQALKMDGNLAYCLMDLNLKRAFVF